MPWPDCQMPSANASVCQHKGKVLSDLKLDIKVGDSVSIDNGRILVTLLDKSGKLARLDIRADKDISIRHVKAQASSLAQNGLTYAA